MIRPPPRSTPFPYPPLSRSPRPQSRPQPVPPRPPPPHAMNEEVDRLVALGATVVERHDDITPMQDPEGNERSEEHTSELQSRQYLVCRLLLEKKKRNEISSF